MVIREILDKWSSRRLRRGIIRTFTANEELDSATIMISQDVDFAIEAYDIVELKNEYNEFEYWVIESYTQSQITRELPLLYNYEINLVSLTKLLEGMLLPNMKITNIGQDVNRKLIDYISTIFVRYFKSDYIGKGKVLSSVYIKPSTRNLFNEDFPENSFSQPTLRECLNYLMKFKACIAKLEMQRAANGDLYFILSHQELNPDSGVEISEIHKSRIEGLTISQGTGDYVSTISSELNDVVSNDIVIERHKLKTEDYIFTSESAAIYMNSKPYDITGLYIERFNKENKYSVTLENLYVYEVNGNNCDLIGTGALSMTHDNSGNTSHSIKINDPMMGSGVNFTNRTINLINFMTISGAYGSLDVLEAGKWMKSNPSDRFNSFYWLRGKQYQNNTLSWSRGKKTIDNLFQFESKKVLFSYKDDFYKIEQAYISAFVSELREEYKNELVGKQYSFDPDLYGYTEFTEDQYCLYRGNYQGKTYAFVVDTLRNSVGIGVYGNVDWENLSYRIEYKPYISGKIIQKQNSNLHDITMADSSTNSSTDIVKYYESLIERNKQLGNPTISLIGTGKFERPLFHLGMKYKKNNSYYYLNKLEYTIKNKSIKYKATLTKDYSNRNINNVLNREMRYYSLPDATEAVIRNEVAYYKKSEVLQSYNYYSNFYSVYCSLYTRTKNSNEFQFRGTITCNRVFLNNNTVAVIIEPYDNVALAFRTSQDVMYDQELKTSILKTEYMKYVDDDGECNGMRFDFFTKPKTDRINYDYSYEESSSNKLSVTIDSNFIKDAREKIVMNLIIDNV